MIREMVSYIEIYLLTHTEFGQILDYLDAKKSIIRLAFDYKKKEIAFKQRLESMDCSLFEEDNGFRLTLANGRFYFLREVRGSVPDLSLPEVVKEHIAKNRPIMISHTY